MKSNIILLLYIIHTHLNKYFQFTGCVYWYFKSSGLFLMIWQGNILRIAGFPMFPVVGISTEQHGHTRVGGFGTKPWATNRFFKIPCFNTFYGKKDWTWLFFISIYRVTKITCKLIEKCKHRLRKPILKWFVISNSYTGACPHPSLIRD